MSSAEQRTQLYAGALILCGLALLFGVLNGVVRGHWWWFGLFVVIVVGASMAVLLRKAMRDGRR